MSKNFFEVEEMSVEKNKDVNCSCWLIYIHTQFPALDFTSLLVDQYSRYFISCSLLDKIVTSLS